MKPFRTILSEQTGKAVQRSRYAAIICMLIAIAPFFVSGCTSDSGSKNGTPSGPVKSGSVDFPGMQLRPGSDKASSTLVGRVRNNSPRTITEIKLRLTMEDVLASGATTTVGDTLVILRQELLPGQSKGFSENVVFGKLPKPKGRHEWNYSIAGITVKE
jgi:hypothetical protein